MPPDRPPPWRGVPGGLRLALRVTPRAGRDGLAGLKPIADGGSELAVQVTAAPEDGRANDAVLRLLAGLLDLPQRDLCVVAGATGRRKQVMIAGDPDGLGQRLAACLAAAGKD